MDERTLRGAGSAARTLAALQGDFLDGEAEEGLHGTAGPQHRRPRRQGGPGAGAGPGARSRARLRGGMAGGGPCAGRGEGGGLASGGAAPLPPADALFPLGEQGRGGAPLRNTDRGENEHTVDSHSKY